MSGSGDNLKLVNGVWNVRLAIPEDVRHAFEGKKEVRKSLKTGRKSEAQLIKQKYLAEWKTRIADARRKEADYQDMQDHSQNWITQVQFREMFKSLEEIKRGLVDQKDARKAAFLASDGEEIQALAEIDEFREAIQLGGYDDTGELSSELQAFDQNPVKTLKKSEALLEKLQNAVQLSTFTNFAELPEEKEQVQEIFEQPQKYVKNQPLNEKNYKSFHAYEVKRKVTLRSIDRHINRLTMLQEFLEKHKFEMDYESTRIFLESLTCGDKTKLQYLCSFNAFYKFMFNNIEFRQKYAINPFMNHAVNKVRRGARKEEVRKAFTKDQVKSLYSNALSQEKQRLADLIRLGAYTGARIEEICQIKLEDLIEVDGVYCIDIKQSKTNAGERLVPIHSELLPLVKRLKAESKDGYLLKTNRGGKYGTKSKEMSSEFSAFKIALGYSKELVFHSFRHTMVTELERADIKNILVMSIVGHEVGGSLSMTFDRYSDGPTPVAKKEAIEKVKFDI